MALVYTNGTTPTAHRLISRNGNYFSLGLVNQVLDNNLSSSPVVNACPLNTIMSNPQVLVTATRIYAIGGYDNANAATAKVNWTDWLVTGFPDTIWTEDLTLLPNPVVFGQIVKLGSIAYLIGGSSAADVSALVPQTAIYSSTINADGSITAFTKIADLPVGLARFKAAVIGTKLYLIGGTDATGPSDKIYVANINTDNTLGTFSVYVNNLAYAPSEASAVITANRIWVFGGEAIQTASIDATFGIGTFEIVKLIGKSQDIPVYPIIKEGYLSLLAENESTIFKDFYFPGWDVDGTDLIVDQAAYSNIQTLIAPVDTAGNIALTGAAIQNQGRYTSVGVKTNGEVKVTELLGNLTVINSL